MAYIVFIGPPGAGKGTQCTRLATRLGIPQLATGEVLRQVIDKGSALSRWLAERLDRGHFAPDYLVMQMVTDRLSQPDCQTGCLFDGFPRTVVQAKQIDEFFAGSAKQLDVVIELRVPQALLVQRLEQRARTQSRADDSLPTILERMRVYQEHTAPVLDYYSRSQRLIAIDGCGDASVVAERINEAVDLAACI